MKEPKLASPGAGLPLVERLVARYILLPKLVRKTSPARALTYFMRTGEDILTEIKTVSDTEIQTRVLIPRQRGLEDSSRHWSIALTLEHLQIVGCGMTEILLLLSRGEKPTLVADTALVKPQGKHPPSAQKCREEFQSFLQLTQERIKSERGANLKKLTHPHPWFGELSADAWQVLLSIHQNIHRNQIQAILTGLAKSSQLASN